jgi:hypothetical protein
MLPVNCCLSELCLRGKGSCFPRPPPINGLCNGLCNGLGQGGTLPPTGPLLAAAAAHTIT